MNNAQADAITALSYEMIRGKITTLTARERDLIRRAQAVYASGGSSAAPAQQVQQKYDRARAILNGAGDLLPKLDPGGDDDASLQAELAATRLALDVLNRASIDRQTIEAGVWAAENSAAWRAKVRKLVLAIAALVEADADCTAFVETAGGDRASALPHTHIHASFAGIELWGWMTMRDLFDAAIEEKVATAAELKGARNAR